MMKMLLLASMIQTPNLCRSEPEAGLRNETVVGVSLGGVRPKEEQRASKLDWEIALFVGLVDVACPVI